MCFVELAIRRYREIFPDKPGEPAPERVLRHSNLRRQLSVWLRDDVCTAIEEYWNRPSFQAEAGWSVRSLTVGAGTSERRCVEEVEEAIIDLSLALQRAIANRRIGQKLREENPPQRQIVKEAVEIDATGARIVDRKIGLFDVLGNEIGQLARIAERFWDDLVSTDDFLHPLANWNAASAGRNGRPADFITSLNPELHEIGDFVVRCLMMRVTAIREIQQSLLKKCVKAMQGLRPACPIRKQAIVDADAQLTGRVNTLESVLLRGQSRRIRESCVILTQVYIALRSDADWQWVGLQERHVETGRPMMGYRLTSCRTTEVVDRIAAALGDLRLLYADSLPGLSALEEAIASGGLVLDCGKKTAYWEAKQIAASWRNQHKAWALFKQLAKKAQRAQSVTDQDLYDDAMGNSTLATLIGRLRKMLPPTLRKLIIPGTERRSYRLDLDRTHLFGSDK